MNNKVKRIDVHSHVLPRELIELIRQRPRNYQMRVEGAGDKEMFVRDDKHGTPLYAEFFDADALRFLIDKVGADRVTIGTDAPFDMAEDDPLGVINAVPGLTDEQRDRIYGLNALELLGEKA